MQVSRLCSSPCRVDGIAGGRVACSSESWRKWSSTRMMSACWIAIGRGRWRLAGEGRAATAHQGAAQAAVNSDARRWYSVADAGLSSPPVERTPWEELPRPCVVEVAGGSGLFPVEVAAERGGRRSHGGSRRDGLASHPGLLEPRDARPVAMVLGTGGPRTAALVQCQCAGDHAAAVPQ
ncbi:hypothetical protein B296_00047051 [Ensete ventricosum]|uniref:Uncharacterized protein n=1 Tax=Ensete ventricosum TaxID=4639 RepID=A0A426XUZ5_ENSVE|nr:hypothetical protein B296_00047051 [Ensete ventricosum]